MPFHYTRTPGEQGGVAQVDSAPPGVRLDKLLVGGPPPMRVALEVVAALCEITHIAHEDKHSHGDVTTQEVWLTGDGAVCVGGFGVTRAETSAPERQSRGASTDLYGLGRVAAELLCPNASRLADVPQDRAAAHDAAISDMVMNAELAGLDEQMTSDVRWFLIYLMSFDRRERPDALRAWRSFIAFARSVPGPDLATWCTGAMRGQAERRAVAVVSDDEEDLAGPVAVSGPLSAAMNLRASAAGGRTLYWDKDDDDVPSAQAEATPAPSMPALGGGSATRHWSTDQLAAMARNDASAPRPVRAEADTGTSADAPPPRRIAEPARPRAVWSPPGAETSAEVSAMSAPAPPVLTAPAFAAKPPAPPPFRAVPPPAPPVVTAAVVPAPVATAPSPTVFDAAAPPAPDPIVAAPVSNPVSAAPPAPRPPVATFRQPGAAPAAKPGTSKKKIALLAVGAVAALVVSAGLAAFAVWLLIRATQ